MSQSLQINTEFMSAHLGSQGRKEKCGSPKVVFRHKHFLGSKLKGDFNMCFFFFFLCLGTLKNIIDDVFTRFYEKHRYCSATKAAGLTLEVIQLRPFCGVLR